MPVSCLRRAEPVAPATVQLAAPFQHLPKTGEDVDELYITRTWQYLPGDILRNR
jgi:protein TonB